MRDQPNTSAPRSSAPRHTPTGPRNARAEASAVAGRNALVLEPSPPAVSDEPWFADDPTAVEPGSDAVTPTSAGATTWDALAATDPEIALYAREHWLGSYKQLGPVPANYRAGLEDYHRLAYAVVSNARKQANGKFGLRYTHGGFGTPFFGDDEQVRVEGTELVVQRADDSVQRSPITTLAAAAAFVGTTATDDQAEHDTVELGDLQRTLAISAEVGRFLGDWFGFATSVLEELRLVGAPDEQVSRVQIWPGHFDPAVEIGDPEAGRRATYGASPGDADHDQPYLYVAPWAEIAGDDDYWNNAHFGGASLSYEQLRRADDPHGMALDFFRRGHQLLNG